MAGGEFLNHVPVSRVAVKVALEGNARLWRSVGARSGEPALPCEVHDRPGCAASNGGGEGEG